VPGNCTSVEPSYREASDDLLGTLGGRDNDDDPFCGMGTNGLSADNGCVLARRLDLHDVQCRDFDVDISFQEHCECRITDGLELGFWTSDGDDRVSLADIRGCELLERMARG